MERASNFFRRIMLSLLLLLMAGAVLMTVLRGMESRSYLFALLLGLFWAAALLFIFRRFKLKIKNLRLAGLLLTLLCLAVNLAWVLSIRIEPFSDYETYWQCACAMATGGEIDAPWYIAMYPHILGSSGFLSVFLRLFGLKLILAPIINVLLTSLSGLLIFAIALKLSSTETACLAYLLWIVCPSKLMLNSLVFSEPLYTCLILLFIYAVILIDANSDKLSHSYIKPVLLALSLGLLLRAINIVRPIATILIISLMLWLVFLRGKDFKKLSLWRLWLIILVPMLLVYSLVGRLWDGYVTELVGMEPAEMPIYNIYVGFNEQTQGQWCAEDMDLLFHYMNDEGMTPTEAQQEMLPHLGERLRSGIDYPRLFSSKLFAFMGNDELGGYTYRFTRSEGFVKICMVICNVFYYGILLLACLGLLSLHRLKQSSALLMPLYLLGLTLAHMLVEVSSRYHYSLIPFLIIIAALSIDGQGRTQRRLI